MHTTRKNIGKKIELSRREKNWNQTDLAKATDIARPTISLYETDKIEIGIDNLRKISDVLGKPLSYFLDEPDLEIKNFTEEKLPVRKIPLISWVSANRFGDASDPFPPGVADEWEYTTARGKRMFALKVKSDCMEPVFYEGEVITINPDIQPLNGDYVVVKDTLKNEATFKQYKVYGKKIVLHPLNPKYQDIEIDHENRYEIIGKVVYKGMKF